jgi:hypothetical protein
MKKVLVLFCVISFLSCNQGKKPKNHEVKPRTTVDSLMEDVMAGHDAAMAKYGRMQGIKSRLDAMLDSISKLSSQAREAASPYIERLKAAKTEVNNSIAAMDKWMEEFNMDSALDNIQERIRYLGEEKLKVGKIKETFLHTYESADSLIKSNF